MERQKFSYKVVENSSGLSDLSDFVAGKVVDALCPHEFSDWGGYPLLEQLFCKLSLEKDGSILEIGPGPLGTRFLSHLWDSGCTVFGTDVRDLSLIQERYPNIDILGNSWEHIDRVYRQKFSIIYHHRLGPQLNGSDKFSPTHDRLDKGGYYIGCRRWGATTTNDPIRAQTFLDSGYTGGVLRVEKTYPSDGGTDKGYDITIMQKPEH